MSPTTGYRRLEVVPLREVLGGSAEQDVADAAEFTAADPRVGYVHSYELTGTVNGPGVRFALFLAGCGLRCQYCHNPDTWSIKGGRPVDVDRMLDEIGKYARFISVAGGGVTLTGGEPLLQYGFVEQLVPAIKERFGLHVALDTAGFLGARTTDAFLADIDLVLLDVKAIDPDVYARVTSVPLEPTLNFARRLAELGRPTWIRYVLVPGLTDSDDQLEGLADLANSLPNVERVSVLPFHQLGAGKWDELRLPYQLRDVATCSPEQTDHARQVLRSRGVDAR